MNPGFQLLQGHPQIDHRTRGLQVGDGPLPADHAAPGGDHVPVALHRAHRTLFRVQKIGDPLLVQDLLEERPLLLLDHQIRIQKAIAQSLGQQYSHRTFPRTRHSNQRDVSHGPTSLLVKFVTKYSIPYSSGK